MSAMQAPSLLAAIDSEISRDLVRRKPNAQQDGGEKIEGVTEEMSDYYKSLQEE